MTLQRRVFELLQQSTMPATISDVAMVANVPYDSAKRAVMSLHAKDLVFPLRNERKGQVWIADKSAAAPCDLRGRVRESLDALAGARRRRWLAPRD